MPPRRLSVLIPNKLSEYAHAVLTASVAPTVDLRVGDEKSDLAAVHVLVSGRPSREQMEAARQLEHVIIPFAGLPTESRTLLRDFPRVSVHNLHHNADATAELAMTLLLAAAKFIVPMDRAMRAHDWTPRYEPSRCLGLAGRTALVLGYGSIGQRVARMCRGFDMQVLATKRTGAAIDQSPGGIKVHPPHDLPSLLPQADALLICLPLTDETEGLLGRKALALMPQGSVLVNIGRAAIVNQKALYDALHTGHLRAAGLDVWYNYPKEEADRTHTPPADHPFHKLDNVVMTPHRGGALEPSETERLRMQALAELLNAAARGESMPNQVDLTRGY